MPLNPAPESIWLWLAVACHGAACGLAFYAIVRNRSRQTWLLIFLSSAAVATAVAIAERWLRTGQGPFLTLFEVLISNLFSLSLIYALAYWRVRLVRPSAIIVMPILLLIGIWALATPADSVPLPPTFAHYWLWLHVIAGKVFLGACLVGVGLAGFLLMRHRGMVKGVGLQEADDSRALDAVVWRFMALAFVFQSFMLVAGAVWAHDAWGRYWAWDPLETWTLVTWLALGAVLHARVTFNLPARFGWQMAIGVFVLAFLTLFGVPFLSLAPHKGAM